MVSENLACFIEEECLIETFILCPRSEMNALPYSTLFLGLRYYSAKAAGLPARLSDGAVALAQRVDHFALLLPGRVATA